MIANIMAQLGNHTNSRVEEDIVRHMALNSIRSFKTMFEEYGRVVIACDDKNYWRKQAFPLYKANRRKTREQSDTDWRQVFNCLNTIRDELIENLPYPVLRVDGAEADDIIAVLCMEHGTVLNQSSEKIMILSGDKDFTQLQIYNNVEQYNPILKKHIKCANPHKFLREHILKGDRNDGIPNILSDDDCLVNGERQKPLSAKRVEQLVSVADLTTILPNDQLMRFRRNERLIDLHMIPEIIHLNIVEQFQRELNKPKDKLLGYFKQHKLKILTEQISEF